MEFSQSYNRAEFLNFLRREFLPDDFSQVNEPVVFATKTTYSNQATKLGVCKSLDLVVYEIKHSGKDDPRVGLSKEAFRMLSEEFQERALVLFVPQDNPANYRFSLIEIKVSEVTDKGKLVRAYSNPRRYSYFLGKGIGLNTPKVYLAKADKQGKTTRIVDTNDLRERFSVEVLTKAFYNELSDWYAWAVKIVRFPNKLKDNTDDDRYNHEAVIRMITRLIFVWFLKQKKLIPSEFFDEQYIANNLISGFNPHAQTTLFGKSDDSKYYKAILQNLFFAMLNSPITLTNNEMERRFIKDSVNGKNSDYDNKKLMRYKSMFTNPDHFVELANQGVPFLNGGLFDCLDYREKSNFVDGFSDNPAINKYLIIPDYLFFGEEVGKNIDLSEFYGDAKKKKVSARGVIDILKRYNFTVEENTPFDQEVSLDPELLGKVFENLLAMYNPETKATARKQTGSFYTPREIVQYMVDESLVAHLKRTVGEELEEEYRKLMRYTDEDLNLDDTQKKAVIKSLFECKILDPACGSGAFPMGVLQQMVHILVQLDPNNEEWKKIVRADAEREFSAILDMQSKEEQDEAFKDIIKAFDPQINNPDYARKLYLIENCVYGVDIQSIAIQISKLRFFISLVIDQKRNNNPLDNFGIRPLPNLEAKFVAANTLIGLNKQATIFDTPEIKIKEEELKVANHKIFGAKKFQTKTKWRGRVKELRVEIAQMLLNLGYVSDDTAKLLQDWDMFDQNASSPFFDPEWMFGVSGGFDIVIGNPPYLKEGRASKSVFDGVRESKYYQGKMDLWYMFACCGIDFLTSNGVLCFIATNNWVTNSGASKMRDKIVSDTKILQLNDFSNFMIFESASIQTMVMLFERNKADDDYLVDYRRLKGDTTLSDVVALLAKTSTLKVEYLSPIFNRKSFEGKYITFSSDEAILDKIVNAKNVIYLTNNEVANGIHPHYDFINNKLAENSRFFVGEGIFGLNSEECENLNLSEMERQFIKPYYNNADLVDRYYTCSKNKYWIIYTDSSFKNPKSMDKYPNLKAHLDKFAEIITSDNKPYGLHRAREERFFKGEKVIALRKCVGRPLFSYSDFDCYLSATFYVIKTDRVNMKYLTGLLNSKLIQFWLKNRGKMQGLNYQLDKEPLVAIPIVVPHIGLQRPLINLVERIISAYQENRIEDIHSIEAQINSYVYGLYSITDEEKSAIDPEGQKPATEDSIKRMCRNMDKNFALLTPLLGNSVSTLENLNQIDTSVIKVEKELLIFNLWKTLMQLQVFQLIASLDLTAFLRSNYRTISTPEKRCNLKWIVISAFETYKYLFGYQSDACNGKLEILKTFAIQLEDTDLVDAIEQFDVYAKDFVRLSLDRQARNISVHYDQNPIKVYELLETISEKEEANRLGVMLGMLTNLGVIVKAYAQKYQLPMVASDDYYNIAIKAKINIFQGNDDIIMKSSLKAIETFSQRLDSIIQSYKKPAIADDHFNLGKSLVNNIKPLLDNIHPGIHMHFIYLDLASAIRAYLSAEHYYEKQVNLRRINIIVYEGFKHIYGYDEQDKSLSFWQNQIIPILETTKDSVLKELLQTVEKELTQLSNNSTINDARQRESLIHYRYETRDNTLPLFHIMIESNPFIGMKNALDLINVMNKLINLNKSSMEVVYDTLNKEIQASNNAIFEKLDNMISILDRSNATPEQKQSIKENAEKIKGLFNFFNKDNIDS